MPQKSAPELFAAIHYLHRLSTEGKRGAKMALESCPMRQCLCYLKLIGEPKLNECFSYLLDRKSVV